jgi:drug/metabolite transporter (DMT)-like permease
VAPAAGGHLQEPVAGILLALAAVCLFSLSDTTSKVLTESLPVVEIAWLRYVAFVALVLPVLLYRGRKSLVSRRPGLEVLRGLGVVGSSILFNYGVAVLPIADATAMSFASPLFITALSIPLLGETVGIRRWSAVVIGFAGILIVARPGTSAFEPAAIFPLLSSMSWSIAMIITRKMSGADSATTIMAYTAFIGFLVLSLLLPLVWVAPTPREIVLGLCVGATSTAGHWLLIPAYRRADASVVAPVSYSQIIWASLLGLLVFGAVPGPATLAGAAVVAASGIYMAHRERAVARRAAGS